MNRRSSIISSCHDGERSQDNNEKMNFFKETKSESLVRLTILLLAAALLLFVVYPIFQVFWISMEGGSFQAYRKLLINPVLREPLLNSLHLGMTVALFSTGIGYFFAYTVGRTDVPFKPFFRSVATFPLISPPFIVALSAIILLGKNGLLTRLFFPEAIFSIYGFWGMVLVQTLALYPLAYLTSLGTLETIDPSIEEASLNQGASGPQTFLKITLPLSLPGIMSSLLLCFIESLADFGTPLVLSGSYRILSVESYIKTVGAERDFVGGAALAILLLLPTVAAFFVQRHWLERKSFSTLSGKASTAKIRGLGWRGKSAMTGVALLLTGFTVLFYGTVLFGAFTEVWGARNTLTIRHFVTTFREGWYYFANTFLLAAIATPFSGILGMVLAYLFVRKRFYGKSVMEVVSMLTFAVPGTVVGIGYLLTFNAPPLALQGTWLIIVFLFIFRNMPVGIRGGMATLKQIDPVIEEAAHSLGAGSFHVFRTITLPLLKPAFYSGLVFCFIKCMVAISAVIFVVSGRWNLITLAILGYVETGELSQAAALSVMLMIVVAIVLGLLRLAVRGREREFVRGS